MVLCCLWLPRSFHIHQYNVSENLFWMSCHRSVCLAMNISFYRVDIAWVDCCPCLQTFWLQRNNHPHWHTEQVCCRDDLARIWNVSWYNSQKSTYEEDRLDWWPACILWLWSHWSGNKVKCFNCQYRDCYFLLLLLSAKNHKKRKMKHCI